MLNKTKGKSITWFITHKFFISEPFLTAFDAYVKFKTFYKRKSYTTSVSIIIITLNLTKSSKCTILFTINDLKAIRKVAKFKFQFILYLIKKYNAFFVKFSYINKTHVRKWLPLKTLTNIPTKTAFIVRFK